MQLSNLTTVTAIDSITGSGDASKNVTVTDGWYHLMAYRAVGRITITTGFHIGECNSTNDYGVGTAPFYLKAGTYPFTGKGYGADSIITLYKING